MESRTPAPASDRGAVLVHTALAILALVAFMTFVVDYGTFWLSKGQAQNAADAGALAGAISMAYESATDLSNTGPAKTRAHALTQRNLVFGAAPNVNIATDITFPPCPPPHTGTCIRVDVYRNQARSNPLPVFFGSLVGLTNQGVRATAHAISAAANKTECLRPWAVLDRWDEANGAEPDWNPGPDPDFQSDSTFDKYNNKAPENDLYVPPSATSPGTGFNVVRDYGRQFALKVGSNGQGGDNVSSGWFRAIELPRADGSINGATTYEDNIQTCGGLPYGFAVPGDPPCPTSIGNDFATAAYWAARGCFAVKTGNMVGKTQSGVEFLLDQDQNATWNAAANGGLGAVVGSCCSLSPRIVPVGVFDIDDYLSPDPNGSNGVLRMVNIFGFFIEGMGDTDGSGNITCCDNKHGQAVIGRLVTMPGSGYGAGGIDSTAAFLKVIMLVR
jgi:Flp pilus assembly protein TadG